MPNVIVRSSARSGERTGASAVSTGVVINAMTNTGRDVRTMTKVTATSRYVGIDPGKATGICSVAINPDTGDLAFVECLEVDHMDLGHYMETVYGQWRSLGVKPTIIIESFTITAATAKNSPAPWSLEAIGLVRFFCGKAGFDLVFQTPAQAKRLATNELLKAAGLYVPSPGGHQADAARHVCYYLMTNKGLLQDAIRATM